MNQISRRRFLEDSVALLAVAAIPSAAMAAPSGRAPRRVSPNEKLRIAVIGFNGRGMDHVNAYLGMPDVELTALCDPDTATWGKALAAADKAKRPAPKTYQDIRSLLESKEIDAVSIATPNHWHALAAIWAMQAGLDVYVEKPVSHNVSEGRRIVEVAHKLGKICQCGTQSRSSSGLKEAMDYLHTGKLGKVTIARGLCYKPRTSIGKVGSPVEPPNTVNYDCWAGPAPLKPITRKRFHYDWHWQWAFGNGDLGNQGIHEMDKARWGLNKMTVPKSTISLGGRFGYEDDGETANTQVVVHDYGECQLIFEVRGLPTPDLKGAKVGNLWYGTEGVMVAPSYSKAVVYDNSGAVVREFTGDGDHYRNFVDACKSRKRTDLNADILEGHLSSALCHLGNISYRLGTLQPFNTKSGAFADGSPGAETFGRVEEHLAANGVRLDSATYRLGRQLNIDQKKETFKKDAEADHMLTREYRAPFVVPAKA